MTFGGNTTCVEIDIPGSDELLILDCGTGFRNLGNQVLNQNGTLKGRIFITHPHWDHLQGFPFFKPFYHPENWFRVYIPPQGDVGCKDILQGHMSSTFFPVSIDMLEADLDCETFEQGALDLPSYSIDYMWANHTVPTAIYKIKVGGHSIVFAPDNEIRGKETEESASFIKELGEFIRDADVLIHDAQFNDAQYEKRVGWGHSSWEKVVPLAKTVGVKRLFLTHHDPDHDDDYLKKINSRVQEENKADFREVCFVKEGQEISLPFGD